MSAKGVVSLDDLEAPPWFADAAEDLKALRPRWSKGLPGIALRADGELPPEAFPWMLGAIHFTEAEAIRHDLIDLLRARADRDSLDAWMAAVLKAWVAGAAPARDSWVLTGAGLGGDATVRALHDAVRKWSAGKDRALAVRGLDVLGRIGSALALQEVATLSAIVRDHSVADEAQGMMERKAAAQGATREQIEDRHVNDCGLDARGERIFSYGPRSFRAAMGTGLELALFGEDGKKRVSLPPPAATDDRATAEASRIAWSEAKTAFSRVLKAQLKRFEQAMITGREWPLPDFQEHVLRHPIVSRIAKTLVWQTVDEAPRSVRVTEDLSLADAADDTVSLAESQRLRVAHPLRLTGEELKVWDALFSDYRLLQPFQQLARKAYLCEPAMAAESSLAIPPHAPIKPGVLYGVLENDGWRLARPSGGQFFSCWKRFHADRVTAVIRFSGMMVGAIGKSPEQTIKQCTFYPGEFTDEPRTPGQPAMPGMPIKLGSVPKAAFSETTRRILRLTEEKA